MTDKLELNATKREEVGRGNTRKYCLENGLIPAVVYGAGKDSQNIYTPAKDINMYKDTVAFQSSIMDLNISGKKEHVIVKECQVNPSNALAVHVDFMRVSTSQKMKMTVAIKYVGEDVASSIKENGGILSRIMTEVEVLCLPTNLPEAIEVDVTNLALDHSIHLSELKLPKGVELAAHIDDSHDPAVVSIASPRGEKEVKEADLVEVAAEESKES